MSAYKETKMQAEMSLEGLRQAPELRLPGVLRRIALAGFMGAGKSTVGRLLAARLGWEFLDLDAAVERRSGRSVAAIFAEHGEAHFRRMESMELAAALGRSELVLALGGGAPEVLTNRLLLEQTPGTATVFLDAPFAALFDRCMLQELESGGCASGDEIARPVRPLLSDPAAAEARFLARRPIYARLARVRVETGELTPEQTVSELLRELAKAAAAR